MEIKARYEHTKYGNFMFNLCRKGTLFLSKHRFLYYLLNFTWGILGIILGLIVTVGLGIAKIFNHKIKFEKFDWVYCIKVSPDYWGGFEAGCCFVRDLKSSESVNRHEFGHSFQNAILGPFMILLVSIPSAIRYWYQAIREKKGKENKPYDSFWAEDSATTCGTYVHDLLNNTKK